MELIKSDEIHSYLSGILKAIDSFCVSNNIRYSLCYGTLIGAVRHKGFIPWDDDIDVMMPRPDFERFVKSFRDERYECIYRIDRYKHVIAKVHDTHTLIKQDVYTHGLYVDVFPVDGKPSDIEAQKELEHKLSHYTHRLNICATRFNPFNFHQPLFANIEAHMMGPDYYIRKIDALLAPYPYESSEKAGATPMSHNGIRTVYDKSLFENYTSLQFEDRHFRAVADWDLYLRQQYGDYMQLPPLSKRRTHHITAWKTK